MDGLLCDKNVFNHFLKITIKNDVKKYKFSISIEFDLKIEKKGYQFSNKLWRG